MGATIFIGDSIAVPGWMWQVTDQWRYTMFVPDHNNSLAKQFNMDVLLVSEPENFRLENHINDLSFLSGAGITVVPFRESKIKNEKGPIIEPTSEESADDLLKANGNWTKTVYIFGSKNSIKTAVSDIQLLIKKPRSVERVADEEHIQYEYNPQEEKDH